MSGRLRGLFVVGTDTGVGKTFVARALCRALRVRGYPVVGLKPYESGCRPTAQDAEALEQEAQSGLALELRCPFRYRAAVSPAVAAERAGRSDPVVLAATFVREAGQGRVAIVESAGGLASPVAGIQTNLDLALALDLPVLLVGRNALGTLNHIALAVEALRRRKIPIHGLVLSRGTAQPDPSQIDNLAWVQRLTSIRRTVELKHCSLGLAAAQLAKALGLPRARPTDRVKASHVPRGSALARLPR